MLKATPSKVVKSIASAAGADICEEKLDLEREHETLNANVDWSKWDGKRRKM